MITVKYTKHNHEPSRVGEIRYLNTETGELFTRQTDACPCNYGFTPITPFTWENDRGACVEYYRAAKSPVCGPGTESNQAFKADDGKPQWDLLMQGCPVALAGVVDVLTFAVTPKPKGKGYVPNSWKQVPEGKRRYEAAIYRHLSKINQGELVDDESGLSHWYHIATNALFLAELHNGK